MYILIPQFRIDSLCMNEDCFDNVVFWSLVSRKKSWHVTEDQWHQTENPLTRLIYRCLNTPCVHCLLQLWKSHCIKGLVCSFCLLPKMKLFHMKWLLGILSQGVLMQKCTCHMYKVWPSNQNSTTSDMIMFLYNILHVVMISSFRCYVGSSGIQPRYLEPFAIYYVQVTL